MSLGHNKSRSSTEMNSSSVMTQVNINVRVQPKVLYFTITQPRQLVFLLNKHQHPVHFKFQATRDTKQKYSISCPKGMLKVNEERTIYIFHKDATSLNSKVDFWKIAIREALDDSLKPVTCERTVYGRLLNEGQVKQVPSHVPPPAWQQEKMAPHQLAVFPSGTYSHKRVMAKHKRWELHVLRETSQIQEKSTSPSLQDSEPSYYGWRFLASLCVFLWSLYVLSHPVASTLLRPLTLVVTTTVRICAAYCAGLTGRDLFQWWQHHQRNEQRHDARPVNEPTTGSPYSEEQKKDHAGGALLTHMVFVVVAVCLLWLTEGDLGWTLPAKETIRLHIAALAGEYHSALYCLEKVSMCVSGEQIDLSYVQGYFNHSTKTVYCVRSEQA